MRTFVTTRGTRLFIGMDGESVLANQIPTRADLIEFVDWVREQQGPPVVVPTTPTLYLNGSSLRVEWNANVPQGEIHFVDARGRRKVLQRLATEDVPNGN